jgi:two-component system chemotaxis response regulator CheB
MIRALIVDDSAVMREYLNRLLSADPEINVVGLAPNSLVARELIKTHNPDVITLDIEMPGLDGLTFLNRLMQIRPTPVVMISALTREGADSSLQALELGAVDFVCKPQLGLEQDLVAFRSEVISKVKAASRAAVRPRRPTTPKVREKSWHPAPNNSNCALVAVGASTGGVGALLELLEPLPANMPPILIVQHMPATFVGQFVKRLDARCALTVREAGNGNILLPGHAYIAPGDQHLIVETWKDTLRCRLESGEKLNGHMPSVDKLFNSVATAVGRRATGILLTGMGRDGAAGLFEMRRVGATTVCQDQQSCIVYGMPRAAIELGAASYELPLSKIASFLVDHTHIEKSAAPSQTRAQPSPVKLRDDLKAKQSSPSLQKPTAADGQIDNWKRAASPATATSHPKKVWIAPAEFHVTCNAFEVLTTILGSCIAVCIRDPVIGCGGMNHFVLPTLPEPSGGMPSAELRYGSYSIERLINAVLSRGGQRDRLEIKIFGGSNVLGTSNVGHSNADFVEAYLAKEGLPVVAKDLRGTSPRRVHYAPSTGQVLVSRPRDNSVARRIEEEMHKRLQGAFLSTQDDSEIFYATPKLPLSRSAP